MSSIHEELGMLLDKATPKERSALAQLLDANSSNLDDIVNAFWWNCQSVFGYLVGSEPSYSQIVQQVAEKLDIEFPQRWKIEDLERLIAQHVLKTVWEKMTPEQRIEFEDKMRQMAQEFDKGGALAGGASIFTALTSAQLSGFGVYLLASTALSTLTGVIGVTLPFALYTKMSSAIAVIIGPVGWIGAGLFAIWKLTGANYKRLIPAILYVSALREKQHDKVSPNRISGWILLILLGLGVAGILWAIAVSWG